MDELARQREANERNARVQTRYDQLTAAGKHGHYESMFRVVREEIERERERCAAVAENPGFIQAQDTEWDEGVNYAKRFVASAIRHAHTQRPPQETP